MKNKKIKTNKQGSETALSLSCIWQAFSKHLCQPVLKKQHYHFLQNSLRGVFAARLAQGWGEDITPVAGALRSGFGVLSSVPGLPPAQTSPDFWQWARGLLWELCWAVPRPLTQPSLPSTLHSLPKSKGENPQIRLTVELSLPFLRTTAKLTHRWFFLASLFFDDVFSMLSIKLKYCLPGITAHQVLYYRWN